MAVADVPKMFFHWFDLNVIYPCPILLDTAPQMSIIKSFFPYSQAMWIKSG